MTIKDNILKDIYPRDLMHRDNVKVQEFNSKEDLLDYLKKNKRDEYNLKKFRDNIKEYKVDKKMVELIRNSVRNNLIKRGIITGTIYEGYKYDIEGEIIDYAELATGNPRCMMKPIKKYDKWFYELYVNMSIPWSIKNDRIVEGAIRLVETIKCLEELNIEIKVNVVLYSRDAFGYEEDYLFILPLASHLEHKDYTSLLPYMDGEFLRKVLFTVMDNNEGMVSDLGNATKLDNAVNLWELKEEELARGILVDLGL